MEWFVLFGALALWILSPPRPNDAMGIQRHWWTGRIWLGPASKSFYLAHKHFLEPGANTSGLDPLTLEKLRVVDAEVKSDPSILS